MSTKFSFKDALRARPLVEAALLPVQFFQEGVYGQSFEDGPSQPLETRIDKLSEAYAARLVNGKVDPQKGWDVVRPHGGKIEVKFRTLASSSVSDSANKATVSTDDLSTKTAEELFFFAYNPTLKQVDLFIFPHEYYSQKGATVRYSTAQGGYTEEGGKRFLINRDLVSPTVTYGRYSLMRVKKFNLKLSFSDVFGEEAERMINEMKAMDIPFI